MQVHVQERRALRELMDDVRVPDLVEQRPCRHALRGSGLGARGSEMPLEALSPSPGPLAPFPSSVQGIMARSLAPTCSIGCSAPPLRNASNPRPPLRDSAIHSPPKPPAWMSARVTR